MDNTLIKELEEFLQNLKVSSYGIASYMSLLPSNIFTAREICKRTGVPGGRIYEVLEDLKDKGLIRIQESRPKKYIAIPPNIAFHNLITHFKEENQKNINLLINRAKKLEADLFKSDIIKKNDTSRIFWSTALGYYSIETLYINSIRELEEELLINVLIDINTTKRISFLKRVIEEIFKALDRGIQIKFLCSFKSEKEQTFEQYKMEKVNLYNEFTETLRNLYNLTLELDGFEMRATLSNIPTYYDLFDKKRVILRLQNPLNPSDIFACLNVLDPKLALELRKKFLNIWMFDAIE